MKFFSVNYLLKEKFWILFENIFLEWNLRVEPAVLKSKLTELHLTKIGSKTAFLFWLKFLDNLIWESNL